MRVNWVSNPREVPPTTGTEQRVNDARQRPYREDASLYSQHRQGGTHPYTLDEIDARIVACAADLAATDGIGTVQPPVLSELVGIFWHRLYRDLNVDRSRLARHGVESGLAAIRQTIARENRSGEERRQRELESQQTRSSHPVTGVTLSRPWVLAACLLPAIAIEVFGSTPSIEQAFGLPWTVAAAFATAISAVLVLTAEQLGNALASSSRSSRRLTVLLSGLVTLVAVAAGIWAIVSLAESRATNLAYKDALAASKAPDDGGGHLSDGSSGAATEPSSEPPQTVASAPPAPDFDFFIPLSILVLATSTLVAFRVEAAHEWNELSVGIEEAVLAAADERAVEEEARQEIVEAIETEDTALLDLAGYVERERALLDLWIARFQAEYQRFCAVRGKSPCSIQAPPTPQLGDVLVRILNPGGLRQPRPERPSSDLGPEAPPTNDPSSSSEETAEPESPEPDEPPRPPPPPPSKHSPHRGRPRRRRSNDGKPSWYSQSGRREDE